MNKKDLRFAFITVLDSAWKSKCKDLHHPKKHQHGPDEICPAEYHLSRQAHIVRKYMDEHGI